MRRNCSAHPSVVWADEVTRKWRGLPGSTLTASLSGRLLHVGYVRVNRSVDLLGLQVNVPKLRRSTLVLMTRVLIRRNPQNWGWRLQFMVGKTNQNRTKFWWNKNLGPERRREISNLIFWPKFWCGSRRIWFCRMTVSEQSQPGLRFTPRAPLPRRATTRAAPAAHKSARISAAYSVTCD